jgi:peptide/nickel transport system substrate-binding protein
VKQFDPTIFKWMYFLTGYVLPKAYYEKVGAEGFRGRAHRHRPLYGREVRAQRLCPAEGQREGYWGGKPEFET